MSLYLMTRWRNRVPGGHLDPHDVRSFRAGVLHETPPEPEPWWRFTRSIFDQGRKLAEDLEPIVPGPALDVTHYISLYRGLGLSEHLVRYITRESIPGANDAGMLKFLPNTAKHWAGPFPGGYAAFTLRSVTQDQEPEEEDLLDGEFPAEPMKGKAAHGDYCHGFPWRIYMYGTDDTSWSRVFRTEADARHELGLLVGLQPLDYYDDIVYNGFEFTN